MKRIITKILMTIVAIIIIIFGQGKVREILNIDPRIWLFVMAALTLIMIAIVLPIIFFKEIKSIDEYVQTHTFLDFYNQYINKYIQKGHRFYYEKKIGTKLTNCARKLESFCNAISKNKIYSFSSALCLLIVVIAIWYKIFFEEDFYSRTIIVLIYLFMEAFVVVTFFIRAIDRNRKFWYVFMSVYLLGFISDIVSFIYR